MRRQQYIEREQISRLHRRQFLAFSSSWDAFLAGSGAQAYLQVQSLRERHAAALECLESSLQQNRVENTRIVDSAHLQRCRHKQKTLAKLGRYMEAEKLKTAGDQLEAQEATKRTAEMAHGGDMRKQQLWQKQQLETKALQIRIRRSRDEELRRRTEDSQRLMLRNKNIQKDLLRKQPQVASRLRMAIRSVLRGLPDEESWQPSDICSPDGHLTISSFLDFTEKLISHPSGTPRTVPGKVRVSDSEQTSRTVAAGTGQTNHDCLRVPDACSALNPPPIFRGKLKDHTGLFRQEGTFGNETNAARVSRRSDPTSLSTSECPDPADTLSIASDDGSVQDICISESRLALTLSHKHSP
eukprot:GHVT01069003.1.p2 GENE.GHVT01069003.1~~GHVT01069003.1.p2  ORF type:complete len:355 (+),score=34.27 GHVT01069003.1:1505-2569(+)